MLYFKYFVSIAVILIPAVSANTCTKPTVSSSYYSSTNEKLTQETAFVVEFTISCQNKVENLMLYADVNGQQVPVTKSPEGNNYQVSWTVKPHVKRSKDYNVRFFDEEGYSNLRKAIRSDKDTSDVKSLFTVDFKHPGTSPQFWISSELLALIAAALVFYTVCRERSCVIA